MTQTIPDIALDSPETAGPRLDQVGMAGIEAMVRLPGAHGGAPLVASARASATVSLDEAGARGIHMSRLFVLLKRHLDADLLTLATLTDTCRAFLNSHVDLSRQAFVSVAFEWPVLRTALRTENVGWRTYPVVLSVASDRDGVVRPRIQFEVRYSSTCPCSAALARQVVAARFRDDISGWVDANGKVDVEAVTQWLTSPAGSAATPHGQRSTAVVAAEPESNDIDILELINQVEEALQTPVQAAVKREDEQEFSRRNGENLMFAEDAARRLHTALSATPAVRNFSVRVMHHESLHPHDAVAAVASPEWIPAGCWI